VVRLVAEGLSNRQIARRLVVSEATVKTHLNNVLAKLDVDGRSGLVAWAWRTGLAGR
jgi:DNA-binding CsgD family transcriptional regulator